MSNKILIIDRVEMAAGVPPVEIDNKSVVRFGNDDRYLDVSMQDGELLIKKIDFSGSVESTITIKPGFSNQITIS